MPYANCKIYFDGSHYIAIPPYPRRNKAKRQVHRGNPAATTQICSEIAPRQTVMKSVFSEKENALIPLTEKQEREFASFNEYVNIYYSSALKFPETKRPAGNEHPVTRRERFDELYRDMIDLPKKERRANLVSSMRQGFETQALTKRFVDENLERKKHNLICRRQRLTRKAYLQDFNFFVTFTFDGEKHTEESFRRKLRNTLSLLSSRKGWKYIGVWERSPEKKRLHFHGIFYIPEGTMPGKLFEKNDYSFRAHKRQMTVQNTYFNKRFGRSDFAALPETELRFALAYLMKYLEKANEKIVYSRGTEQYFVSDVTEEDVVCRIGVGERKLLLYDDFVCWDEGEYLGKVNRELIRRLCAKQLLNRLKTKKQRLIVKTSGIVRF